MLKIDRLPARELRKVGFAFLIGITEYGTCFIINGNISDRLAVFVPYNRDRL
jgi:hypothetical protein